MATTGHESEAINVQGLKASLQKLKTDIVDGKAEKATTLNGYGITDAYTKSETYTKTEVNGLVDTPHQEYVTVSATSQTTDVTTVLPNSGQSADTIYRVANWDGSVNSGAGGYDVTKYSEYAWDDVSNPNKYVFLCVKSQIGEVFDISVYNNNAKYADLTAALNGGANIPQSLQKGGMSVKFVCSSDNKYVQYRLTSDTFNTTPANWQGVDEYNAYSETTTEFTGVIERSYTQGHYYNFLYKTWTKSTFPDELTVGFKKEWIKTSGVLQLALLKIIDISQNSFDLVHEFLTSVDTSADFSYTIKKEHVDFDDISSYCICVTTQRASSSPRWAPWNNYPRTNNSVAAEIRMYTQPSTPLTLLQSTGSYLPMNITPSSVWSSTSFIIPVIFKERNYVNYKPATNYKYPLRYGIESLSIPINCFKCVQSTTKEAHDGVLNYNDFGYILIPQTYNPEGKPTKLIIFSNGVGSWSSISNINQVRGAVTPQKDNAPNDFRMNFMAQGYAILEMCGIPYDYFKSVYPDGDVNHYGYKTVIESFNKAYSYVTSKYNLEKQVALATLSMGRMAGDLLIYNSIIPFYAHVSFCGVTDLFKQAWCHPFNNGLKTAVSLLWGFSSKESGESDNEWFVRNLNLVLGYYPMLSKMIGDKTNLYNTTPSIEDTVYGNLEKVYQVPVKMFHGDADPKVSVRYTQYFTDMVKRHGGLVELQIYHETTEPAHGTGWYAGNITMENVWGYEYTASINYHDAILFLKRFETNL